MQPEPFDQGLFGLGPLLVLGFQRSPRFSLDVPRLERARPRRTEQQGFGVVPPIVQRLEVRLQCVQHEHDPLARPRLWLNWTLDSIPAALDSDRATLEVNVLHAERLNLAAAKPGVERRGPCRRLGLRKHLQKFRGLRR